MTRPQHPRVGLRRRMAALAAGTLIAAASLIGGGVTAAVADTPGSAPCDIYAAGGTPCVAAHATTRALYSAYTGALYQVTRSSDNATLDIHPLVAGGVADAAAQDAFCADTTCLISTIYDQSGNGNDLTQGWGYWPGPEAGGRDRLAQANLAVTTVHGQRAYGVFIAPGTGYRKGVGNKIATGDQPEGIYAVLDGTHYNDGCCFDYGNAETSGNDTGNGHMETIYFGTGGGWGSGAGSGPWIMSDLENGIFSGAQRGQNTTNPTINHRYLTAIVKGESGHWAIRGGDAQDGSLSTIYDGARPTDAGYDPMSKEGSIILGVGGDNSNASAGTFYEGVMTAGYPTAATEDAVQADIVAAAYGANPAAAALVPGASVRIGTGDGTAFLARPTNDAWLVDEPASSGITDGEKWIVRTGLANDQCYSFESASTPGSFMRHVGYRLRTDPNDNGWTFLHDATFCPQVGNDGSGVSLSSVNFPAKYVRFYQGQAWIGADGGTDPADAAADWSTQTTLSITPSDPDTTAPVATLSTSPSAPDGQNGWYRSPVTLTASATDDRTVAPAVDMSADGGATWQSYTGPVDAAQGTTAYRFRATDEAGNVSAVVGSDVRLDSVAPTASATVADSGAVAIAGSDSGSGVAQLQYRLGDGAWTTVDGSSATIAPSATSAVVTFHAVDVAGNVGADGTVTQPATASTTPTPAPSSGASSSGPAVATVAARSDGSAVLATTGASVDGAALAAGIVLLLLGGAVGVVLQVRRRRNV